MHADDPAAGSEANSKFFREGVKAHPNTLQPKVTFQYISGVKLITYPVIALYILFVWTYNC